MGIPQVLSETFMLQECVAKISSSNQYSYEHKMFLHSEVFLLWLKIKLRKNKKMFNGIINTSTVIIVKADHPMIG